MGSLHPQIVHFAVALLIVGVLFRALSLVGRPSFFGPAAATLLFLGTVAAAAATYSGDLAHGPVEAMPGLRQAVSEHEAWGGRSRNVFFIVMLLELVGLALSGSKKARPVLIASTFVGLVGVFCLYEAGEHGGAIVYDHAGGVGIRPSDPEGVRRLLLAGLYQQALVDRKEGNAAGAAELMDEAAKRFPDNADVRLLGAESQLIDRKNAAAALEALRAITPPADNRQLRIRHGMLTADALLAAGQRDGAIATLQQLNTDLPNARVKARLDALLAEGGAPAR
ncbi:MAG: hypothetical protein EXQ59_00375 [Acidobacteria bacterium]|nr:hypothetical protein [Acidobacteriota bacterium]